jgi:ferrous iron transport protein A
LLYQFFIILKKTLANTKLNTKQFVKGLEISEISSKLLEMGLYEGQEVEVVFKAPFGDPIAVNVGGYLLSLRLNEACLVEIH